MGAEESPASDGSIDETKEYIAAEVAKLEKESKRLKKEVSAFKELQKAIDSGNASLSLQAARSIERTGEKAEPWQRLLKILETRVRDYFLNFPLRDLATKRGWSIDGRFPEYTVEGCIRVHIDESRLIARVGQRQLQGHISAETIAEAIDGERSRLFSSSFDKIKFVNTLFQAYKLALAEIGKGGVVGETAPVHLVHRFLLFLLQDVKALAREGKGRAYGLDQFAVDLGRLMQEMPIGTDSGFAPELHPIRDAQLAIFVFHPIAKAGQNYGYISFHKSGDKDGRQ